MGAARAARAFPASVHDAETRWYDTSAWPSWVDGLARVLTVAGDWPRPGATVTWESGPAGRGRVRELVIGYERLGGQTLEVEDDSIRGRQSVAFTSLGDAGVEVSLSLEYRLKRRRLLTPLLDTLFIRRAMTSSLHSTLSRFGVQLAASRDAELG
jgi:hypothetical protein